MCEFCRRKGHSKEQGYNLIGYPHDFKSKRKVINGAGHNAYMTGNEFTTARRDGYDGMSNESSFNSENATKGKRTKVTS